jgi:protocatechuate 3,4-dioxygenase beta subunit
MPIEENRMASDTPLKRFALLSLVLLAFWPASAGAQIPTGTVTGQVFDTQGRPIAGATVTATSPALQGEQTTTSSANGAYNLKFLPPGPYTNSIAAP